MLADYCHKLKLKEYKVHAGYEKQYQINNGPKELDVESAEVILIGLPDHISAAIEQENETETKKSKQATYHKANEIRKGWSAFQWPEFPNGVLDLGNLKVGKGSKTQSSLKATHKKLEELVTQLLIAGKKIVLLGPETSSLTALIPAFQRYMKAEHLPEELIITITDLHIALGTLTTKVENQYLNSLLIKYSPLVKDLYHLGSLEFATPIEVKELVQSAAYTIHGRGALESKPELAELALREAALALFNLKSVANPAAMGMQDSIFGLSPVTFARLGWYAGQSSSNRVIYLTGIDGITEKGVRQNYLKQTAAAFLWYYLEGLRAKLPEQEIDLKKSYFSTFSTQLPDAENWINFINDKRTNRWWMELSEHHGNLELKHYFPCEQQDLQAMENGEIPYLFWLKQARLAQWRRSKRK